MSVYLVRRIHGRSHGGPGPCGRLQCRVFSAVGAIVIVTGASLSAAGPAGPAAAATAAAARTGLGFGWGYNHDGELGNGTNTSTSTSLPVAVEGLTGVT